MANMSIATDEGYIDRNSGNRMDKTEWHRVVADAITAGVPAGTPIQAVMEPTGMAWFPVARWLNGSGVEVIRVKGQRVKALRTYLSEHAKTDLADAHLLGAMPSIGPVPSVYLIHRYW